MAIVEMLSQEEDGTGFADFTFPQHKPTETTAPLASKRILEHPTGSLGDSYKLGAVLGTGHFGVVRACTSLATGEALACKSVEKRRLRRKADIEELRREVAIMRRIGAHPNIVQLRDVYEDEKAVHIVEELCAGGELFDAITAKRFYSEAEAGEVFADAVAAVAHCHAAGVMHRDLKPENLLLAARLPVGDGGGGSGGRRRHPRVKLCDFGLALDLAGGQQWEGMAGSPFYMAPEVILGRYGTEADIWSLGVVLYILLCGVPPFWGENERRTFQAVVRGHASFAEPAWKGVSAEAKALVRLLLSVEPARRPSATSLLAHPWVQRHMQQPPAATAAPAVSSSPPSTPVLARSLLACFFPAPSPSAATCLEKRAAAARPAAAAKATEESIGRGVFDVPPEAAARRDAGTGGACTAGEPALALEEGSSSGRGLAAAGVARSSAAQPSAEERGRRRDGSVEAGQGRGAAPELEPSCSSAGSSASWSLSPRGPLDSTTRAMDSWWSQQTGATKAE